MNPCTWHVQHLPCGTIEQAENGRHVDLESYLILYIESYIIFVHWKYIFYLFVHRTSGIFYQSSRAGGRAGMGGRAGRRGRRRSAWHIFDLVHGAGMWLDGYMFLYIFIYF